MIVKRLKELYDVDTISQDKGWKKLQDAISEVTKDNEEVTIDFTGTNVVDPWNCVEFRKLLQNPLLYMEFTNSPETVKRLKIMCVIEGLDDKHITNKIVEIPREKTAEEKKIERLGRELVPYFVVSQDNPEEATFKFSSKYTQVHSTNTLAYVKFAIGLMVSEHGMKRIILDINGISILNNVIEGLVNIIVAYKKMNVDVFVEVTNKDVITSLKLFLHKATSKMYNSREKVKILQQNLKINTAGMLLRYKKSKALDEFGRHGNGEIISSRIALFKGIKLDKNGHNVAIIQSFNNNYFYTKTHWMVEHDDEIPTSLHPEIVEITMDELGYGDVFLGSQYHFMLPIQQDVSENKTIITELTEKGSNVKVNCTIPERIKLVFDDWGIQYDKETLNKSIIETRKNLNLPLNDKIALD